MKSNSYSKRALFLATAGTTLEWAEYIFYGYMALKLSHLFFPQGHETLNLIKTFGLFAAGYLMRPIGAILFGHIGDKYGRRPALMLSMLLMGFATMGIGLLPTYQTIGFYAPLCLLGLRLIQGLAVSGEYNGAAIFVIEQSKQKPCFASSFVPASAAGGMVLGGIAAYIVNLPNMPEWAYRVPFFLGGLGCLLALWLRQSLSDSKEFIQAKACQQAIGYRQIFTEYKLSFIRVGAIAAITGIYVYIGNVYYVVFLTKHVGLSKATATLIATLGQAGVTLLIPLSGYLADFTNPLKFYKRGLIASALCMPFVFILSEAGLSWGLFIAMILYAICNAWMSGPMMKIIQDEFPTLARYRGTALAWSIAVAIFGGTALMVGQWLQDQFSVNYACALYVSLFALITYGILSINTKQSQSISIGLSQETSKA